LTLYEDPAEAFSTLLADGYFDADNPLAILAKVTHEDRKSRMPPQPGAVWTPDEADRLRRFVAALNAKRNAATAPADETFPAALPVRRHRPGRRRSAGHRPPLPRDPVPRPDRSRARRRPRLRPGALLPSRGARRGGLRAGLRAPGRGRRRPAHRAGLLHPRDQ